MKIPAITALVPMKGHSERVPNKNIRLLNGKPACHWIIESLSESKYVNEILINTDSKEIADIVNGFEKVRILERPDFLIGDMVSIQPLIEYDIKQTDNQFFIQTHSTNPMVQPRTIDKAIEDFFNQSEHDALFSVTPIQTRFYWKNGEGINHDPKHLIRTQDLEPIYEENSCFYIFSKETNHKIKNRLGSKPMMYPISALEAADIDTMTDFHWAEFLLSRFHSGELEL